MKRLLLITLIVMATLAAGFPLPALAQEPGGQIPVLVDGLPVTFDVPPVIQEERTLVPFRAVAAALNVQVNWDGNTRTVSATDGKNAIRLQVGNQTAYRNNSPILLDVAPQIISGRTLIPLRFFSEAFGCQVNWDDAINGVRITSPPKEMAVIGFYALGDPKTGTSSWTDLFGKPYPETAVGNTDVVRELALGWYSVDKDGNLLTRSRTGWQMPEGWVQVLASAWNYKLKTEMVVQVTDGDGTLSSLLANEAAMARAATDLTQEARARGYHGVNLDFEGLGYQDSGAQLQIVQDRFTRFVGLLSRELKAAGLDLTLTLHAPNSVYKGYDYKALGALADRIIIMAYDYGSTPEPVSLVEEAVTMARAAVPSSKLVLGISAPTETAASILGKVGIAKRYNLGGIALWRLGLVSDTMWEALRTTVVPRRAPAKTTSPAETWTD
ncbi:MAG: hypothetical protein PWP70_859 [Moorella sp. (in: firmicutes)]|nr:hypothetical protein [Moorella sp. (in: firmicutes)]